MLFLKTSISLFRLKCFPLKSIRNINEHAVDNPRKGLVLGLYKSEGGDPKLTPTAERFNERVGGRLLEMIKECGDQCKGKGKGNIFNNIDPEFWSICVVEIGREDAAYNLLENLDEGRENVREASAVGTTRLRKDGINHIMIEDMGYAEQAAEGASLSAWRFQEFKDKKYWKPIPTLELFESSDSEGWTRGLYLADAQNLARKLCEMPSNIMTPTGFAQAAVDVLCPCNVGVDVRYRDWIETKHLEMFLTIAKSSCEPPIFLEIMYCGAGPDAPVTLMVAKGTTYDTGGLYLFKDYLHGDEQRAAMAGAAVVVASIRAAAMLSLPMNIQACIPLCENLTSGMAVKPGDVVYSRNGVCVGIHSPDKDGRICMADALEYGQRIVIPKLIIDIGAMSESMVTMLGDGATGCWTNSRQLWKQIHKASAITGDRCWRMPLWDFHKKRIMMYDSVDVSNEGVGRGDPSLAAAFLHYFVKCSDYVHFDISGTGMASNSTAFPYYRYGRMTGRPTRTIIQLLYQIACPQDNPLPC